MVWQSDFCCVHVTMWLKLKDFHFLFYGFPVNFLHFEPIPIIPRTGTGSENRERPNKKGVFPWD